jgi:hypothetical protein
VILLRGLCVIAVLGAGGCATPDEVIFVTATEMGLGADATMGTVNIGYDRNEFVIGPAYPETGGLPPVYARLNSDLAVFNPRIRQIYATGEAARLATDADRSKPDGQPLSGDRRIMIFGTTTNFGLKVHFVGEAPTSFNFGYKRKDFSVLPLQSDAPTPEHPDQYGSVIAGIALRVTTAQLADSGIAASQFIATGDAAENLASTEISGPSLRTRQRRLWLAPPSWTCPQRTSTCRGRRNRSARRTFSAPETRT